MARGTAVRCLAHVPVGVEIHATGGVRVALRLHPLPPSVEAGHNSAGPAAGTADPLGSRVGAAGPGA